MQTAFPHQVILAKLLVERMSLLIIFFLEPLPKNFNICNFYIYMANG